MTRAAAVTGRTMSIVAPPALQSRHARTVARAPNARLRTWVMSWYGNPRLGGGATTSVEAKQLAHPRDVPFVHQLHGYGPLLQRSRVLTTHHQCQDQDLAGTRPHTVPSRGEDRGQAPGLRVARPRVRNRMGQDLLRLLLPAAIRGPGGSARRPVDGPCAGAGQSVAQTAGSPTASDGS
jgi:hypothetical protein